MSNNSRKRPLHTISANESAGRRLSKRAKKRLRRKYRRTDDSPYICEHTLKPGESSILQYGMSRSDESNRYDNYFAFMPLNLWLHEPELKEALTWEQAFHYPSSVTRSTFDDDGEDVRVKSQIHSSEYSGEVMDELQRDLALISDSYDEHQCPSTEAEASGSRSLAEMVEELNRDLAWIYDGSNQPDTDESAEK